MLTLPPLLCSCNIKTGPVVRKPVFGVSVKSSFKPFSSATETSSNIEISPVASLHILLSYKRISKALIRLRECAGSSAPVQFANPRRQVFSRRGSSSFIHHSTRIGYLRSVLSACSKKKSVPTPYRLPHPTPRKSKVAIGCLRNTGTSPLARERSLQPSVNTLMTEKNVRIDPLAPNISDGIIWIGEYCFLLE